MQRATQFVRSPRSDPLTGVTCASWLALLAVLLLLAGCGLDANGSDRPKAEPTGTPASLMLDFESSPPLGQVLDEVANEGTSSIDVTVETAGESTIEVVEGPGGGRPRVSRRTPPPARAPPR